MSVFQLLIKLNYDSNDVEDHRHVPTIAHCKIFIVDNGNINMKFSTAVISKCKVHNYWEEERKRLISLSVESEFEKG
ncbi:unnamed protein product [Acanthoscelides obtectus]|uniref:Uncharacterized protein n=1 Tax=Acanthoscelides obtectus TaxID=200917 RepID=A0A9P0JR44_ACAOB|nr:unnamed protein product [Acanthoscelides obtectus]CAK1678999.1 hypothetical protein AOBTE_LOCUS32088 [Acanthoscelides obtectus]